MIDDPTSPSRHAEGMADQPLDIAAEDDEGKASRKGARKAAGGADALKKKEFIERVKARLGGANSVSVAQAVPAVLEELGLALDSGQPIALAPLGRLSRITRGKGPEAGDNRKAMLKLMRPKARDEAGKKGGAEGEGRTGRKPAKAAAPAASAPRPRTARRAGKPRDTAADT